MRKCQLQLAGVNGLCRQLSAFLLGIQVFLPELPSHGDQAADMLNY